MLRDTGLACFFCVENQLLILNQPCIGASLLFMLCPLDPLGPAPVLLYRHCCCCMVSPQGFLAADRKTALKHFSTAEEYFKHCKEKVGN